MNVMHRSRIYRNTKVRTSLQSNDLWKSSKGYSVKKKHKMALI